MFSTAGIGGGCGTGLNGNAVGLAPRFSTARQQGTEDMQMAARLQKASEKLVIQLCTARLQRL